VPASLTHRREPLGFRRQHLRIDPRAQALVALLRHGLENGTILRYIELPLGAPTILAGIKTSAVINVGTATIAAFIGAGGYGERIVTGLALNDHAMLLAGAIPAAALALLIEGAFRLGERWLVPAGCASTSRTRAA
jgi:osmoprotectant transport system permease protein